MQESVHSNERSFLYTFINLVTHAVTADSEKTWTQLTSFSF